MNDKELIILKKAKLFFKDKTPVHIKKHNGYFHNGLILQLTGDLLIIDDDKKGTMPIYLMEILEIEKREKKNE